MNLLYFNWTPILIPFIVGIVKFRNLDTALRILFLFVAMGTVNELVGLYLRYVVCLKNTMPQGNVYYLGEFLLLGLYYRQLLKDRFRSWVFLIIISLFITVSLVNLVLFKSWFEYPAVLQTVSKIFLMGFSLLYFYKVMDEAKIENLWKEPVIYINVAVLVYYAGNLFYSLLFNLILEYSRTFSRITVQYFSILNAVFYFLIVIGFWQVKASGKKQLSGAGVKT
ncbi:MAG: hypothetical protein ACK5HT_03635 [Draconibacterium sp.]